MMRRSISLLRQRNGRCMNSSSAVVGEEKIESGNPNDSSDEVVVVHGEGVGNTAEEDMGTVLVGKGKRENDSPPYDDVCPICFGEFTVPCKTNCGHWFCGSCILQFWYFKASFKKCKCPICSGLISMLIPELCLLSRQEKEVIEVLENIHRYNRLFQGGVRGFLQNVLALPRYIKRIFQGLMDPDRFRINYYTARFVGLTLGLLYQISPFDFIPTGGYAAHRLFELFAMTLVVIFCLIGLCCRAIARRRLRQLAAAHNWD